MTSFTLKSFAESSATLPLLLISFAAVYKFGYFWNLDALWILPSLSVQSLLYSILTTVVLFTIGVSLSFIYLRSSEIFGYFIVSICFLVFLSFIFVRLFINDNLMVILKAVPLFAGAFYYMYAHFFIFGGQVYKTLLSPLMALLSIGFLIGMVSNGINDSKEENLSKNLSVVIFEEQKSYPNEETDWRLLENLGDKLILINLKRYKDNKNYFIKVIEIEKIDNIL